MVRVLFILHQFMVNGELIFQISIHEKLNPREKSARLFGRCVFQQRFQQNVQVDRNMLIRHIEPANHHLAEPEGGVVFVAQGLLRLLNLDS